ncbi:MAG: Uncharacterised protein [Hyphomonas sp. TMED17]|nr:MAG: Uncharacterised protein [Hyphomonas sp. TMED17]
MCDRSGAIAASFDFATVGVPDAKKSIRAQIGLYGHDLVDFHFFGGAAQMPDRRIEILLPCIIDSKGIAGSIHFPKSHRGSLAALVQAPNWARAAIIRNASLVQ